MADYPDLPPQAPTSRKGGCLSCLTFLLALAALIIASLAWLDVEPPQEIKEYWELILNKVVGESSNEDSLEIIKQKLAEAKKLIADPETKEKGLSKMQEAKKMMSEWNSETTPKVKEFFSSLSEKTDSVITSIKDGSKSAREQIENLIQDTDTIQEESKEE